MKEHLPGLGEAGLGAGLLRLNRGLSRIDGEPCLTAGLLRRLPGLEPSLSSFRMGNNGSLSIPCYKTK